jgi:hypothetical protein
VAADKCSDAETRLLQARRQRFELRSRLKVLRRLRDRSQPVDAAELDRRIAESESELDVMNDRVEGMRADLGRPHRSRPAS